MKHLPVLTALLTAFTLIFAACKDSDTDPKDNIPDLASLRMSAVTNRPNSNLYIQNSGDSDYIRLTVSGIDRELDSFVPVKYTITDIFGGTAEEGVLEFVRSAGSSQSKRITIDKSRRGHFTFTASVGGLNLLPRAGSRPRGFITYAVVPDPAQRRQKAVYGSPDVDKYMYFGMYLIPLAGSGEVNFMEYLGVDASISGELKWNTAFERNNATNVDRLNSYTSYTVTRPCYILSEMTAYIPRWARTQAGGRDHISLGWYGGELSAYGEGELVKYIEGLARIHINQAPDRPHHYYQVLWEPVDWWGGWAPVGEMSPDEQPGDESLVRVYELSYEAIHRLYDEKAVETGDDSWKTKAVVLGPTCSEITRSYDWHVRLFNKGLANYIDGLSIHPYDAEENALAGGTGSSGNGNDLEFANDIRNLMTLVNDRYANRTGPRYHDTPFFWSTEHGIMEAVDGGRPLYVAQVLTRHNLILLGEGFDANHVFCFADYNYDQRYGFFYNLTSMSNSNDTYAPGAVSPKQAVPAFAAAAWLLKGYRSAGRLNLPGDNFGYQYKDAESDSVIYALWNYGKEPSGVTVNVGAGAVKVYDIMGNEIPSGSGWSLSGGNLSITTSGFVQYVKVE